MISAAERASPFPTTSQTICREQACLFRMYGYSDTMEGCFPVALPVRKRQRMKGFDYSTPTAYFITICTHEKRCLFGTPSQLNTYGKIASDHIAGLAVHFPGLQIDHYVVMPNHIHILLTINWGHVPAAQAFPNVSAIIGSYKSSVSRAIHQLDPVLTVWQKSFHDHIPRTEKDFQEIWKYIEENPHNWINDVYHHS